MKKPKRKSKHSRPAKPLIDKLGRQFPPPPGDAKGSEQLSVDRGGRPYAVRDEAAAIATLRGLGGIMATSRECAAVLHITEPTLFAFFTRCPAARDAWESGKDQGKSSLRRSQFNLAQKNATMAIFLGMNYLGQRDRREFVGDPEAPIKHEHSHVAAVAVADIDLTKLSLDELVRLHTEKTRTPNKD